MYVCVLWIVFLNWIATTGHAFSDVDSCTTNGDRDMVMFENEYCLASKDDVTLGCPTNKIAVLSSMRFGVKKNFNDCIKRVMPPTAVFCCKPKRHDVLYDGECLQDIWSDEDVNHYRRLIHDAIAKCKDTKLCVLTSDMFRSLQKEIPSLRIYSSYIQLVYHCISAITDPVEICSSKTKTGKEIHILSSRTKTGNRTCTCRVTSHQSNSKVKVRAVDVRTTNSGLVIKSEYNMKDLSNRQLPLNGFKDVISGKNVQITARNEHISGDEVWLHVSGSDGQDVNVVCEGPVNDAQTKRPDTTTQKKNSVLPTDRVSTVKKKSKSEGYWPVIYLAAGSGITLVLIACIIGSLLICRCSLKKPKPRYENPYNQSQVNYNRSGQYDTVPGGMPNIPDSMAASIQDPYEWPHAFVK